MGGRSIRVTHNPELLNRPGFAQPRGGGWSGRVGGVSVGGGGGPRVGN